MFRKYLEENKNLLFPLILAILTDQFLLGGALRQRIQRIVEAVLGRLEGVILTPAEGKTDAK